MVDLASDFIAVYPFRIREGQPEYLVLFRSEAVPLPGIWQPVTGTVELGETAVQAAVRELREETGLEAESLWNISVVGAFYDWSRDRIQLSPNIGARVATDASIHLCGEHDDCRWAGIDEAVELVLWQSQKDAYRWLHHAVANRPNPHSYLRIQ